DPWLGRRDHEDPRDQPEEAGRDREEGRRGLTRASSTLRIVIDRFLPQGAILLSVLSFGSYAMGLVRDRTFARTFGAGGELDAYNAAFVVPELLFDVLIAGGLAAPFVPIFMKLRAEDQRAADDFARTILTLAVLVMAP